MGIVAILFNVYLNNLSIFLQQKAPCEIWWKVAELFQKRRRLYLYIATHGEQILIVTKKFYHFDNTL